MKIIVRFLAWLCLLGLSCCDTKRDYAPPDLPAICIDKNFKNTVPLSELAEIDSVCMINSMHHADFGGIVSIMPLAGKIVIHTHSPATITIIDKKCNVVKQLKPDFIIERFTEVHALENELCVLNRDAQKIYILDSGLNLKTTIRIPVFAQSARFISAEKVLLYTGSEITEVHRGRLLCFDVITGKVLFDLLPVEQKQRKYFNFLTKGHFPATTNEVFFWDSRINFIYAVNKEGIHAVNKIDYGRWSLPTDFYETADFENVVAFVEQMRNQDYAFRHFRVQVNENFLLMHSVKSSEIITTIFNRVSKKSITFLNIEDDLLTGKLLSEIHSFFVSLHDNDSFVAFLPEELMFDTDSLKRDGEMNRYDHCLIFGHFIKW
jgi:hypothetical protein